MVIVVVVVLYDLVLLGLHKVRCLGMMKRGGGIEGMRGMCMYILEAWLVE